jgi:hypothetical protein
MRVETSQALENLHASVNLAEAACKRPGTDFERRQTLDLFQGGQVQDLGSAAGD